MARIAHEHRGALRSLKTALAAALLIGMTAPAPAQMSLGDIEAALGEATSELERVDQLLADPDPNRRIAAMRLLLKSGDPVFEARARETGLLSSDPEMRAAALKAVLDAGGTFRILFDLSGADEEATAMQWWLRRLDGTYSVDAKSGEYHFTLGDFDEAQDCWLFNGSAYCALRLVGTSVSLGQWTDASGTFELNAEGELAGAFRTSRGQVSVPARIPLLG